MAGVKRLKAITVAESLTAMILITISFGVGFSLYLSVLRTDRMPLKTRADAVLQTIALQTQQDEQFMDETIRQEPFVIEKRVYLYEGEILSSEVYVLELEALTEDGKTITTHKQLIHLGK